MSGGPHYREHLKKEKSTFYPHDLIRPRFLEFYPRSAMFRSLAKHRPSLQRWFSKNSGILRNNVSRRAPYATPLDTPAPHQLFCVVDPSVGSSAAECSYPTDTNQSAFNRVPDKSIRGKLPQAGEEFSPKIAPASPAARGFQRASALADSL